MKALNSAQRQHLATTLGWFSIILPGVLIVVGWRDGAAWMFLAAAIVFIGARLAAFRLLDGSG